MPPLHRNTNIVMGNGAGYSATYGAKKVELLAATLVIPIAVPQNKVGKRTVLDIQHMCRVLVIPNLVKSTK
jgi:hypothetical protein